MTMASPEYLIAFHSEAGVSVRQLRCASKYISRGPIAFAFCLASVLSFFALGPLAKLALLRTNANHFKHGQIFLKFAPQHLFPRHPDVVAHSHEAVAVVGEAEAKADIARVNPPRARADAVLVAEGLGVNKVFKEAAGDSMGNLVDAAEEVDPQKRTEFLHKNAERAIEQLQVKSAQVAAALQDPEVLPKMKHAAPNTVGTGGFTSGVAMSAGIMALVAMAFGARKGFQQLPPVVRRHAVVVMEADASADAGVEMDSSVDRNSVNAEPFPASTIFTEQRGNLTVLDADAMLKSQAFPIAPEELIAKTKDFIACDYGANDTDMLASDFQFVGPFVGPLSRQQGQTSIATYFRKLIHAVDNMSSSTCAAESMLVAPMAKRSRVDNSTLSLGDAMVEVVGHATIANGDAASNGTMENLNAITTAWEALQPRIQVLRQTAERYSEGWEASLQQALSAVARSDDELIREREQLAIERYGSNAAMFCTLPPSISILLPASAQNEEEIAFAEHMQSIAGLLSGVRERLLVHIIAAKSRGDRELLRTLGPKHSQWGKEIKMLQALDSKVGKRLTAASRRINAYRLNQQIRDIDPSLIGDIDANFTGYLKVLDFYRHTDSQRYSFNRQLSGPQHFADLRRNVAVLEVWDDSINARIFNQFAVSGVDAPGVILAESDQGLFAAQEVADGLGETYSREHDAEFKLCTAFCSSLLKDMPLPATSVMSCGDLSSLDVSSSLTRPPTSLRASLFSKKPLCASCRSVVFDQLLARMPGLKLQVLVDEVEEREAPMREATAK